MEEIYPYGGRPQNAPGRPYKSHPSQAYAQQPMESPARRQIAEIRIFYTDQTWDTFVPKK